MLELVPPAYITGDQGLSQINSDHSGSSYTQNTTEPPKIQSFNIYHVSELSALPKRRYLIKGLLDMGGMSVVYGASNSGKTFLAIDIACHIGMGWKWQDNNTKSGTVIYIACEGGLGIEERTEAFRFHYGLKNFPNIFVIPQNICLSSDAASLSGLLEILSQIKDIKLIIVDTLARAMGGGDENSAKDMGIFVQNCDLIRTATKAHIMIIHHTGKDETKGARGSSSLKCAIDTEIQVKQNKGIIEVTLEKQRDGKKDKVYQLELKEINVGKDEDSEIISSCVLINSDKVVSKNPKLSSGVKRTYQVLLNLLCESGVQITPKKGMPQQKCVLMTDFKSHFIKAHICESDKPTSIDKTFSRHRDKLLEGGYIGVWAEYVWLLDKRDK